MCIYLVSDVGISTSPIVWYNAVTAEVFALNNLFNAALLYMSVEYALSLSQQRSDEDFGQS